MRLRAGKADDTLYNRRGQELMQDMSTERARRSSENLTEPLRYRFNLSSQ